MDVRTQVGERQLTLSNLDKVLFDDGWTKAEMIDYYVRVAPVMLPHLQDRAATRVRFPDGVAANQFYEKNAPSGCPDWVRRDEVATGDGTVAYVVVDDPATLVLLANLASVEFHVPQWRFDSAEQRPVTIPESDGASRPSDPLADRIVIDCDPGEGITMLDSAQAALIIGAELASDDLIGLPRTTGSKGLQIAAAIRPSPTEQARGYVRRLAERLARRHPDRFVTTMDKKRRIGHIFLDYNQNMAARNTVCPYSLRGRPSPGVATPLTWDEIAAVERPTDDLRFSPEQVLERIEDHGDLAGELFTEDPPPLPSVD
ncbi:MAG TPA: non-homologous end-joining DNA ligase [Candidatus Avipropionibacterium avicola]|uniref:Non-homologous end-joining DNA ligase n=1 Tax=Candidatus Avipropionibacterium avicola TaxID=2840701 RepID=A0A9D1H0D8_9ACTN|nr:non-homologous end-joining DNA ligase [Candidatus Avipropionibacterium avicola]